MAWLPVCTRQEVSRCHTGGEYEDFVTCRRWRMQARGNNAGFETKDRRHQKYKTGVLGAPQKGQMFSKSLKKLIIAVVDFRVRLQSRKRAGSLAACRSPSGRRTWTRWSCVRSDVGRQTRPHAGKAEVTRSLSPCRQVYICCVTFKQNHSMWLR